MAQQVSDWIWHGERWTKWKEATVHVSTHALHYGSSAFEGIRAYETPEGPAIFRLGEHLNRLLASARLLGMQLPEHLVDRLPELCIDLVARNDHRSCYIRPIIYRGVGGLRLNPAKIPVALSIFSFEWGQYLGDGAVENGIDAGISSWRRAGGNSSTPLGKIGGQYVTSQFASAEAERNGYGEAILLDAQGAVSEGAGENLFIVEQGTLITPPLSASILGGITRDTVIALAEGMGIPVRFETMLRDRLYLSDEVFMTGTAAEVTPVRSIDGLPVGLGGVGEITRKVQKAYFDAVNGRSVESQEWLTLVPSMALAN